MDTEPRVPELTRHCCGCRIESSHLAEFVAGSDGWSHVIFAPDGDDWTKIGEGRTLAEARDICHHFAEKGIES